jgi:Spy/CpxP family protein refolding chaperone
MQSGWKGIGLALAATLALAGSASAQFGPPGGGLPGGGPPGGGPRGGGAMMLRMPEVQTELKLTDEQKTRVSEMLENLRGGQRGRFEDLRSLGPEEAQKRMADRRAQEEKLVNGILTADQQKRFRQLQLQQQGVSALNDKSVQDELKLTDEQRTKVQTIQSEQWESMRALFQSGGEGPPDFAAIRPKLEAMRKQSDDKLTAVLTAEQQRQWKAMLGPPFKFPEFRFGPPPGGPGGPPGPPPPVAPAQ